MLHDFSVTKRFVDFVLLQTFSTECLLFIIFLLKNATYPFALSDAAGLKCWMS